MSGNRNTSSTQRSTREKFSNDNISTKHLIDSNNQAKTSSQAQGQANRQSDGDSWTSNNTSNPQQAPAMSSSTTSTCSTASSTRGSSIDSLKQPSASSEPRKSSMQRAMDKAKSKLGRSPSGAEALAGDEKEFERQKAKAVEKKRRREEFERLCLEDRTKYGSLGGPHIVG